MKFVGKAKLKGFLISRFYEFSGQPVVCDRHMEVAALVSSINPAINANYDSIEVGGLQQELLWLLHDRGYLKQYPMALGKVIASKYSKPTVDTFYKYVVIKYKTRVHLILKDR